MNNIENIDKYGFINYLITNNAKVAPLEINYDDVETLASMNPSIWIKDGVGYINIRAISYNLFNSRYREYTQGDQPLSYVCKKATHLKTENYFGTIDLDTLQIKEISKVNMLYLHDPAWWFCGLEDARIIMWDEHVYLCGVRRDTKENGEGRMELSEIENIDGEWNEINRVRIPATGDDDAYLEKNWMPVIDKPYTWLKWSAPLEWAIYDKETNTYQTEFTGNFWHCFRGDSHVIHIDNYYYAFVHLASCTVLNKLDNARMGHYKHYIIRMNDNDMSPAGFFGPFTYDNRFSFEFGCGMAFDGENCYLTYAENDAAAYIIKFNKNLITNLDYNNYEG